MARKVVKVSDGLSQYECVKDDKGYRVYSIWNDGKRHRWCICKVTNLFDALDIIRRNVHEDLVDDVPYTPEERGVYSSAAPWGAPGMRVSDFL